MKNQLKVLALVLAFAFAGMQPASAGSARVGLNGFDFTCDDDIWEIGAVFERFSGGVSLRFIEDGIESGWIVVEFEGTEFSPAGFVDQLRVIGFNVSLLDISTPASS